MPSLVSRKSVELHSCSSVLSLLRGIASLRHVLQPVRAHNHYPLFGVVVHGPIGDSRLGRGLQFSFEQSRGHRVVAEIRGLNART
jgi:hypothetical protein